MIIFAYGFFYEDGKTYLHLKVYGMKSFVLIFIILGTFILFACNKEDLFEQPSIEVTGYELKELPGTYTYIDIEMQVINNDSREAHIKDVEYLVIIEGFAAEKEEYTIDKEILVGTPLELKLPLTLVTKDAIQLLIKLDAGEELNYEVNGTFHVNNPVLKWFDLPINIDGKAWVDTGFDDFYKQPEVIVNDISGTYSINGLISYTFDLGVNCIVENKDSRDVIIDEVEYTVNVEGVQSQTHLYSDSYQTDIDIEGGDILSLTLPVSLNLNPIAGAALVAKMLDGTIDYTIEGTFHAIEVEGVSADFLLPLYVTGNTPASLVGK